MGRPKGRQRATGPYRHGDGWQVVTREADGTRGYLSFETEAEGIAARDEYNDAVPRDDLTLEEALAKYERHYLNASGNKTRSWKDTRWRIVRMLGDEDLELVALTPRRAQQLYDRLVDEMKADSHRGILTHTKTFLAWAAKRGIIRENPFEDVEPQGRKKKGGRPKLRRDEARTFRDAALRLVAETQERVMFERYLMALVALYMGARASEITQRRVRDIDDDCQLYIIPDGKTDAAARTERIPPELQPFFRRLVQGRPGHAFLFGGRYHEVGKAHDHRYITRYCVRPLATALGLPDVTAHGLRGTASDGATEEGELALTVSRWLGHANEGVTRSHYISKESEQTAREERVRGMLGVIDGGKKR